MASRATVLTSSQFPLNFHLFEFPLTTSSTAFFLFLARLVCSRQHPFMHELPFVPHLRLLLNQRTQYRARNISPGLRTPQLHLTCLCSRIMGRSYPIANRP